MTEEIRMTRQRKQPQTGTLELTGRIVGRNRQVVDPLQVEKYAQLGCKETEIARLVNIDRDTLRYNFAEELERGKANLKMSLRRKQVEVALQGNVVMLIWLGKNLLGQGENGSDSENSEPLPWSESELE